MLQSFSERNDILVTKEEEVPTERSNVAASTSTSIVSNAQLRVENAKQEENNNDEL